MISRRDFLEKFIGAGAVVVFAPELLRACQSPGGSLIHRAIPSTGEMLPVISFGARSSDPASITEILKTLIANGGRVVDVLHGGPAGEHAARTAAAELALQDKFVWTTTVNHQSGPPPLLDPGAIKAQIEEKLARFTVPRIDLAMVSAGANAAQFAALMELKKEGRLRYVGVHELLFPANGPTPPYPPTSRLEALMRNEQIDFIGTDYHIGDRRLEETILPLAIERKIGVLAYFPFDRGRLFQRAGSTPLPEWAGEFDARTWAQFFLKYVISHPAVTMARTGTTRSEHMLENLRAGMGRLPDEATRKRMAQLVDTLPPTPPAGPPRPIVVSATLLDRYAGAYTAPTGFTATFRRDGNTLMVTPGNNPEVALLALTEARFQDPRGPAFEFQLDARGNVTGVMLQQGPNVTMLQRK